MNEKYINGMNEIKADDELKRKIISSGKQSSSKQVSHFFTLKKAMVVVAAACAFALFISFGLPFVRNDSNSIKQGPAGVTPLFAGFVITAYAADGTPVEVKPNVDFPLGKYQMTMSSVPGFPVNIVSDNADTIKLTVTDGGLLLWSPPTYKVLYKGKKLDIKSGDTVYWTPMDEAGSDAIAAKCTLVIKAYKNNEILGGTSIKIASDDNYVYTGRLEE
jgi:hypothetical protein